MKLNFLRNGCNLNGLVVCLVKQNQYMSSCPVSIFVLSMVDVVSNTPLYIGSAKGVYFSYLNTFVKTSSGCSLTTVAIPGLG
jgi:hypothetical protein